MKVSTLSVSAETFHNYKTDHQKPGDTPTLATSPA